ncbi:MAG: apolipoprotein N-acyltransferase, partial [Acetobacteraceae bacterium]|nr:apolipoprotein N-acyltransferase [Acetobacteraceae bacterium]
IAGHLRARQGWRAWATALGLGALGAAALPPVHAVPVLLLVVPGLLLLLEGRRPRQAAAVGFAFGMGHHIAGLYWISHALLTEPERWGWLVPVAVPGIALPLALFLVPVAMLAARLPGGWRRAVGFAGAWVLAEMARGVLFTGFPWNLIGTVWAFDALPLQPAAFLGVHGLGLLTLLAAASPLCGRRGFAQAMAGVLLVGALSLARLWPEEPPPEPVALVLVQGNIAQEVKWREETRLPIFLRYVQLTRQGAEAAAEALPGARVVAVWPETASPFLLEEDPEAKRLAAGALPEGALLLAGTVRVRREADGRLAEIFNSLVALDPAAAVAGVYDKAHLVPFGEYMPLSGWLPIRVVRGAMDFSAGPGRVALRLPGLPAFAPLICYEAIFPAAVVPAGDRPAWLLNVTNDAWFGHSAGPYQHLAAARLRAVEEGLPMVRAAQTGISAVFDSRGREVVRLGLGRQGVTVAPLPAAGQPTPAARFGLWIPLILSLAAVGGGLAGRMRRRAV